MNQALSWEMQWYFDHWHLRRYLVKGLREAAKRRAFAPLKDWINGMKAHLKYAVDVGSRTGYSDNIKHIFNTSLYHIAGIHSWDQIGAYLERDHQPLHFMLAWRFGRGASCAHSYRECGSQ
ncbi:hypothetical protein ANCCAN_17416 [Ancylostoma caninum]|uniref:Uncharacterized protein n=1 Tax=Ancylostoma caninum TaxID=29170 RepID=A0A368FWZ1_ANCCA|nr:hypothetical protein ANCCAN_17416 [Ancylostoma caninum]